MRLHPLSIPYRAGESIVQWAWILIVGAIALPNVADTAVGVAAIGSAVIGFLVLAVAWQVAYYRRYEYDLTEDTFDIDSGVLSRRSREIPYGRVQNVSINRNVVQRALGLAELRLETAGGSGTEAHLQYVSRTEARRLQDELSQRKRTARDDERDANAAEADAGSTERTETLFDISPRELSVLGFVSFLDLRILPIVIFAVASLQGTIQRWILDDGLTATATALLVLVFVAAYLAIATVRAAYDVANYYGFRLVRGSDELRYERGLLQRFSGTIPLAKVQALTVSENVLARLVDHAALSLETAGFSPGETGGSQAAIPIAGRDRVLDVARRIEPVDLPAFERPPKRARQRYVVRYAAVVLVVAGLGGLLARIDLWIGPWYWPLALLLAVPVAAHLKWRQIGYALTDDYVLTRHGFWTRTTKIVPYHRVQTVADTQTIFQRRRSLATLHVDVAGSRSLVRDDSRAIDLDRDVAGDLRETIGERMLAALDEPNDRVTRPWAAELTDAESSGTTPTDGPSNSGPGVPGPD